MNHGGTLIQSGGGTFSGVSTVSQLAAAIDGLSGLIDVTPAGTTLTITATSTGPTSFNNLRLEFTTPATTTTVPISGISDADAAAVNLFTLDLDGIPVNQATVDLTSVSTVAGLASELDEISGIDVSVSAPGELSVASSTPGHVVFSNLGLKVRPELVTSAGTAEFTENGSVTVDGGLVASYNVTTNLAGATVSLSPHTGGEDELGFTPTGGITGAFSGGTLTLSGSASLAEYQSALRSVVYTNASDDPATSSTTVTFRLSDGVDQSAPAQRVVNVTPVNDRPTVALDPDPVDYMEDQTVAVDGSLTLMDPDHSELQSATLTISTGFASGEDELLFSAQGGITGSFAAGALNLSGTASTSTWQTALRSVQYRNTSESPDETTRSVTIVVSDGTNASLPADRQVTVMSVNDAPALAATTSPRLYLAGQTVAVDDTLGLSDADHTTVDSGKVSITGGFVSGQDWLGFTTQNGIAGFFDDTTGELELIGSASLADYRTALRSVTYSNAAPGSADRVVTFEVDDGVDWSDPVTRTVVMTLFYDDLEDGTTDAWSAVVGETLRAREPPADDSGQETTGARR